VHTHDDNSLLSKPLMEFKTSQGVTTVVIGNCGISLAPFTLSGGSSKEEPESATPPQNLLGDQFEFGSVESFYAALEAQPASVNVVSLCGHTTLRLMAMGPAAAMQREANADELVSAIMHEPLRPTCCAHTCAAPPQLTGVSLWHAVLRATCVIGWHGGGGGCVCVCACACLHVGGDAGHAARGAGGGCGGAVHRPCLRLRQQRKHGRGGGTGAAAGASQRPVRHAPARRERSHLGGDGGVSPMVPQ
jgi:hypothetical protein